MNTEKLKKLIRCCFLERGNEDYVLLKDIIDLVDLFTQEGDGVKIFKQRFVEVDTTLQKDKIQFQSNVT
jgi:hypothetical protein